MAALAGRAERDPSVLALAWQCASLTLTALALISLTGRLGSVQWHSAFASVADEYRRVVHGAFGWIAAWLSFDLPPAFYDAFLIYTLFGSAIVVSGTLVNQRLMRTGLPVYGSSDEPINDILEQRQPVIDALAKLTMIFAWGVAMPLGILLGVLTPLLQLRLGTALAALAGAMIMLVQGIVFSFMQAGVFFAALAANYLMNG